MKRFAEGRATQNGDGGPVAHQPADAHDDRQDALADGAPQLRLDRHCHAHLWVIGKIEIIG